MPIALARSPHKHRKKNGTPPGNTKGRTLDGQVNYYEGGRRLIVAKAKAQELKVRQLEGELVRRDAIEKVSFATGRRIRDGVENLPARLSGIFAAMTDQGEIFTLFTKEIQICLENLNHEPRA